MFLSFGFLLLFVLLVALLLGLVELKLVGFSAPWGATVSSASAVAETLGASESFARPSAF